jgi:3-oxoadipate enol-lactonase
VRFLLSDGRRIGYLTRGAGPVIAFLHPVGLCGSFWDSVVAELESDFRLIAIDLPGHGESDVPRFPFSLDDAAQDVTELLTVLGRPPCILVGCSMGGMIAQGVALHAPSLLRGLVLSNTSHQRTDAARKMLELRAASALNGMPTVHDETIERWFSPEFRTRKPEVVTSASRWLLQADPVVHAWSWQAIASLSYDQRLAGVTVPAMVLAGAQDRSVSSAATEALKAILPYSCQYVFDAGHLPPLEVPKEYAQILRDFAQKLES